MQPVAPQTPARRKVGSRTGPPGQPVKGQILIEASVLTAGLAEDAAIVKALGERCQVDLTDPAKQAVVVDRNPAAVLKLLKEQKAKLLSRPKILAGNDQSASLQIGARIPFRLPRFEPP